MKKYVLLLLAIIQSFFAFAQSEPETAKPSRGVEIQRRCAILYIEGEKYENTLVELKSNDPDYFFTDKSHVNVKVSIILPSGEKKVIYKKKFKDSNLYIFRSGQIQVGKPNFDKIVITPSSTKKGIYYGTINEKEGVY
jgi:hypothetical protein